MTRLTIAIESPRAPGAAELLRAGEAFSEALYPPEDNFFLPVEELEKPEVTVFIGRIDGVAAGMAALVLEGESAELKRLFVADLARGAGLAGGLLDALEEHARSAGARVIRLETGNRSVAAIALYEKRGYLPIPRFGPYVDAESSICMELTL